MKEQRFSLDELATRSGLEKRTIRSWISPGLVAGPDRMGRNAGYGPVHLDRLQRVADLLRELLSGGTPMNTQPPFALTAALDKASVWRRGGSERYLVVTLQPQAPPSRVQGPLNLALVLDVSGSMEGAKL